MLYLALPIAVSNYSLMKTVKSRTKTRLLEEHQEGCIRVATTTIKPDIEILLKQKRCQISH
jgi:hypothetical protein